jgi:leucyl/phenylalanyl-tRNA--protein transferase
MSQIPWLDDTKDEFPDVSTALHDPDGLLAAGGDLSSERLISAYSNGIFPWFDDDQPILWWSPDPRSTLIPSNIHISKSLKKDIRKNNYTVTYNRAFSTVINHCAKLREDNEGTWITQEMHEAYCQLHEQGIAHSIEAWHKDTLIGGLYGINIGQVFFGESMFSLAKNGSKIALIALAKQLPLWNIDLIDCQVHNDHLASMGATKIPRAAFIEMLKPRIDGTNTATWLNKGTLPL